MKLSGKTFAVAAMALAVTGAAEARIQSVGDATADGSELLFNLVNYTAQNSYTLDLGITIEQFRANPGMDMAQWTPILNADSNFQSFLATYDSSHNVTWGVSGGHFLLNDESDAPKYGFYTTSVTKMPAAIDENAIDISNTMTKWGDLVNSIQTQDSNADNNSTFRSVGEPGYTAVYGNNLQTALPFDGQGAVGEWLWFVHEKVNEVDFFTGELAEFPKQWYFNIAGGTAELKYSAVPVPAAVWMFGTGLLGLFGLNRRKAA